MDHSIEVRPDNLTEVQTLLEQELNLSIESAETDLIDTGILDSLLLVDLIMLIETRYGIVVDINQLEFEDFRTIGSISSFIERNAAG